MSTSNGDPVKKLKILVVDDEPNMREVLQSFLEGEGYQVTTADNGVSAMSKIADSLPHLVLLDIRMPDMDGMQCLRLIKNTNSDIQVVMMSGFATVKMAKKSLEIGAFDYISKPLSFDHLREVIEQVKITKFLEFM